MRFAALIQFVAAIFVLSGELKLTANAFQLSHFTKRDVTEQHVIGPGELMHAGLSVDDADRTVVGYVLGLNGSVIVLVQTAMQHAHWQGGSLETSVNMSGVNPCSCLEPYVQICFLNCTLEDRNNYISLVNLHSVSVQVEVSFTDVKTTKATATVTPTPRSTGNSTSKARRKRKHRKTTKHRAPKKHKPLSPSVTYSQTPTPISEIPVPLPDLATWTDTALTSATSLSLPGDPVPPSPTSFGVDYGPSVPGTDVPFSTESTVSVDLSPPLPAPYAGEFGSAGPNINLPSPAELPSFLVAPVPSPTTQANGLNSADPNLLTPTPFPITSANPFALVPVSFTASLPIPPLLATDSNQVQTDSTDAYSAVAVY